MKSRFKSHHILHSLRCCFWVIVPNLLPVFFVIAFDGIRFIILYFFSQLNKRWHCWVRCEIIVPSRLGADTQSWGGLIWNKTLGSKYKMFAYIGGYHVDYDMIMIMMIMTPFPSSAWLSSHSGGSLSGMPCFSAKWQDDENIPFTSVLNHNLY